MVMTVRALLPGEEKPRREPKEPRGLKSRRAGFPGDGPPVRRAERDFQRTRRGSAPVSQSPGSATAPEGPASPAPAPVGPGEPDPILLERLRERRTRLAQEAGVPAYVVFSNAALVDMAKRLPRTPWEFLQVSGVGQVKAQRYGEEFLGVIRDFLEGT